MSVSVFTILLYVPLLGWPPQCGAANIHDSCGVFHGIPREQPPPSDQTACPLQVHHLAAAVQPDREGGARLGGAAGRDALRLQRARDLQRWQHALAAAAGPGWADAPRPHAPTGEASRALAPHASVPPGVQGRTPACR